MITNQNPYCSDASLGAGEALPGTAPVTKTWFLLEYPGPPGAKALPESTLPEPVKTRLTDWQKSFTASRLLLIRQDKVHSRGGLSLFIGSSAPSEALLFKFHLPAYEALLEIDPAVVLAQRSTPNPDERQAPLFLVCTNGKRDPCCTRHGVTIYDMLTHLYPGSVWQSSHMGGHRFAANVILLPEGCYYGRVEENDVEPLLRTVLHRQIYLPNLRGRSCYSPPAQAAEYYLRLETGNSDLNAYTLISETEIDQNTWDISFLELESAAQYNVFIQKKPTGTQTNESCGASEQTQVANFIQLTNRYQRRANRG